MTIDVRNMTDEALEAEIRESCAEIWANGFGHPDYAHFPQVIAEVCDEFASRTKVMRDLCEAYLAYRNDESHCLESMVRLRLAREAYQAMKGEKDAVPLSTDPLSGYTEPA